MNTVFTTIDEYIASYPKEIQEKLKQIRNTIKLAAPAAEELISYGMPAFKIYSRPLVYFAAFKNHIGFYATASGHAAFAKQLSKYKQGKGSVQFPLKESMPLDLIAAMVKFRVDENMQKEKKSKKVK